jgi:6,7-dimethyl-8-ribityllumazine synthase
MTPTHDSGLATTRIAFVHALWHADIVREAHAGFVTEIEALGVPGASVETYRTPGAFEIPLHAQKLARLGRYQAIVAAGFVVDGGIYRHEFVAEAVINGLMQVQLATEVPVFSVVLTPHHFHEHDVHQRFFHAHFRTKGAEAAHAVHATLRGLSLIEAAA